MRRLRRAIGALALICCGACDSSGTPVEKPQLTTVTLPVGPPAPGLQKTERLDLSLPIEAYARFYGMRDAGARLNELNFVSANHQGFSRTGNAALDAPASLSQVVGRFKTAEDARRAIPELAAAARGVLSAGPAKDITDLPQTALGDSYGWGWQMTVTSADGRTVFRAEYTWQRGRNVVTVIALDPERVPETVGALATELDRALATPTTTA